MRRDNELVRAILLAVEADEGEPDGGVQLDLPSWTSRQINWHVMLLVEAGYLVGEDMSCVGAEFEWEAQRLTYVGHEFLDTVRDPEVWRRTRDAASKVGGLGLQALFEIGKGFAKQVLVERTGIALG